MRLAEREQDERRLLLEQARAGDLLAAAEFMEPEEAEKVCREWLASEDRHVGAYAYWTRSSTVRTGDVWILNSAPISTEDRLPLTIVCRPTGLCDVTRFRDQEVLHEADSLPALCRWLRDNLPRLRAEAGL